MNKDSWIALIIASIITILAATPLYYSRGPIESKDEFSEDSSTKATEPMKRTDDNTEATTPTLNNDE